MINVGGQHTIVEYPERLAGSYHRGWGYHAVQGGGENWFHLGVPITEAIIASLGSTLVLGLNYTLYGSAKLAEVHLYSGSTLIGVFDPDKSDGEHSQDMAVGNLAFSKQFLIAGDISRGLTVSTKVSLGQRGGEILFRGFTLPVIEGR